MKLNRSGLLKLGFLVIGLLLCLLIFPGPSADLPTSSSLFEEASQVSPAASQGTVGRGSAVSRTGLQFSRGQPRNPSRSPQRSPVKPAARPGNRPDQSAQNNLARLAEGDFEERAAPTADSSVPQPPRDASSPDGRNPLPARRSPAPAARLDSGIASELDQLDEGYQAAQNLLFPNFLGSAGTNANPFDNALQEGTPDTAGEPPPSSDNEGNPSDGGDPPGEDGGPGEGGGEPPVPEPPDTTPPVLSFNFLLTGKFGGLGESISRAAFNGSDFVFEDGTRYGFFPGAFHTLLSFGPESLIVIEDVNNDGREDLLVSREIPSLGTSIELFEQDSENLFQVVASTALYLERVQAVALFDIEGDGQTELLLSLDGQKRLYVYEKVGASWDYSREFVLPVEPGLLLVSNEGSAGPGKILHIIDSNLQVVLNARSARPVAFSFGLGTPLQRMRSVKVDFLGTGTVASEVRIVEMADRLVLFDLREGQPVAFASLARGSNVPFLVIGDYSGHGVREVIWLPR